MHLLPKVPLSLNRNFEEEPGAALGLVPGSRNVTAYAMAISWDATTFLNIAVLALIALLLVRFLRTGGIGMLRMMGMPSEQIAVNPA